MGTVVLASIALVASNEELRLFTVNTEMIESVQRRVRAELQEFRAAVRGRFDAQTAPLSNSDAVRLEITDLKERRRALEQRLDRSGR